MLLLARSGRSLRSIPAEGDKVTVKAVVNQSAAAQNHIVTTPIHPTILDLSERLIRSLGVGFVGLDLIAPTLEAPLAETGGIISEINVNPGLHHHHLVSDPHAAPSLAERIADRLLGGPNP